MDCYELFIFHIPVAELVIQSANFVSVILASTGSKL